ncbi:MAG: response regulator transcription factor [Angelakisella sp.]
MSEECVLIVDDDLAVRKVLHRVLASNGFSHQEAASGEEALAILRHKTFDLIIMDITLGNMDGFEVVQHLRGAGNKTPIIILSGRSEDYNTLYGLDIGADDYITKPFNPVLLGAKVKALIRRNKTAVEAGHNILTIGPFTYYNDTMRLFKNKEEVPLSNKENQMMKLFISHVNQIFTKEQLYQQIWGDSIVDTNAVMVYVSHLRNKIEDDPKNPAYLKTAWGLGYQFVVASQSSVGSDGSSSREYLRGETPMWDLNTLEK